MSNVVVGIMFSNERKLPLAFLNSTQKHLSLDTQVVLFTNFQAHHPMIDSGRLRLIEVDAATNATYNWFKNHAEQSSGTRWYRYMVKLLRWVVRMIIRLRITIPDWLISFLFTRYSVNVCRYFLFYNFLRSHKSEKWFISDVTDVIFQSDIFSCPGLPTDAVAAFSERNDIRIEDEIYNSSWIRYLCEGEVYMTDVMQQVIKCSGTIYVDGQRTMQKFIGLMCITMLGSRMAHFPPGARSSGNPYGKQHGTHPADQGTFNLLSYLHPQLFGTSDNGEVVYTMGTERSGDFVVKNDVISKIGKDTAPAVVHQYNRHSELNELVNRSYGDINK